MRKLTDILAERAKNEADDRDLTSRTDLRKKQHASEAAFIDLARTLVALSARQLDRLGLPEAVADAVREARNIESAPALARALKRVRKELRDGDPEAIRRRLDELGQSGRALAPGTLEAWCERLATGSAAALEEFAATFPGADRQRLRALVRNVSKAPEASRTRALGALGRAVREAMSDVARAAHAQRAR